MAIKTGATNLESASHSSLAALPIADLHIQNTTYSDIHGFEAGLWLLAQYFSLDADESEDMGWVLTETKKC